MLVECTFARLSTITVGIGVLVWWLVLLVRSIWLALTRHLLNMFICNIMLLMFPAVRLSLLFYTPRKPLLGSEKFNWCKQDTLPNNKGSTFYFRVNDVDIYINGANWIPVHPFLSEVVDSDYEQWMALLKDSHQNMLRVWGGGVYESDKLNEIANKEGILIWQDFMFACGQYPADPEFKANVACEAEDQITRLRNHPSLVIFAGNNEDVLPSKVSELSNIAYIKGSPFSPGDELESGDLTSGDVHQWNVWHGSENPYQQWGPIGWSVCLGVRNGSLS